MSSEELRVPPDRTRRLGRALLGAFIALIILPAAALVLIPTLANARQERERFAGQLETLADAEVAALVSWAQETARSLDGLAGGEATYPLVVRLATASDSRAGNTVAARSDFARRAAAAEPFDRVLVLDMAGVVRGGSDDSLLNADLSGEAWFKAAVAAADGVAISGPLRDPTDGQQSLFFTRLVADEQGEPVGVVAGRTGSAPLEAILALTPLWGETADYYLVRAGRQYVVPPRLGADETLASDQIIAAALAGRDGSGAWRDYRGEPVVGAYRWVAPLNMALVLKQDEAEALAGVRGLLRTQLLVGGLAALLAAGLALALGRRMTGALDAASQMSTALGQMTERLHALSGAQEETIQARTRALETIARMGHAIASETDYNRLLRTTIDMIREQLGYYHAQVFLLDDLRQFAMLRASTGAVGEEMLARGHKLAVGSQSVVGQAVGRGEPVLASDTRHAEYWFPNPLLPDTRAELAVPLRLGDQVVGALDVQATEPDVFDETTIAALQAVGDQLAVAIRNAQLFEEKESLLSASLELTQMLTHDGWDAYSGQRRAARGVGFAYDLAEVRPLDETGGGKGGDLRLPIALRGAVIGELTAQLGEGRTLTDEDKQLVGQVLDRVALAVDNARLVEQTQLSLRETNRLYRATQSIAEANSVDKLADALIGLAATEQASRAFLLLLENPAQPPGRHWVAVSRAWLREADDPLHSLPERVLTGDHPLLTGVEGALSEPLIIREVEAEGLDDEQRTALEQLGARSIAIFPIVPPIPGRSTLGWLVLHSADAPDAFGEDEARFFETVADQAGTALEGLRLFEQTQARARRLQAINEVSRTASSILNPDILLPMIVDHIAEAFGYYHVQVFLTDDLREWAVLRASTGEVGQALLERGHRLAVGSRSVIGRVTESGEPVVAHDTEADPFHRRNELLPDTRAEMAIPLRTGDRVIGALDVQSTQIDAFDPEAQAILQSLADQIAVTLENAQLFQEIQDRVAELTTVNLVSQAVSRAQTLDELYEVVTEQLVGQFGTRYGFLGVLDDAGLLRFPIFIEDGERMEPPDPQPVGGGLSGHVLSTRQVLLLNENTEQAARELGAQVVGAMPRSVLVVPLTIGEEVMGVLSMQDAEREQAYDEAHVRQLTTLAAYIAVKIRNAELLEEAQRRADELGFLFEVTRAAVASADLGEALEGVGEVLVREIGGAEAATFYLALPGEALFEAQAGAGYGREPVAQGVRLAADEGLIGLATASQQVTLIEDAQQPPRNLNGGSRTRAALLVPLASGQEVLGVLAVESSQAHAFDEGAVRLLEGASSTLVAVIQSARLLEQIRQANEQLRELDKLKSQFLANMSHELRTPLNSIIGFSRVMLKGIDGPLNELQAQDLTTIYNSGQHLLNLINNILDVSKIEAGKMEIQAEYIGLGEIIEGVIAAGRGLVKDSPIEIVKEVEDDLPEVYGDAVRIRQVLLNLMSNAAKFTKGGSITLRAARKPYNPRTGEPPRVQIDVQDTGIGIAPEDMGRLFEAFSQVDGSTTRQVGGTGLGLTISKEFIEMMGGRIWVESEAGAGSTFSFTVPLYPPGAEEAEVLIASEVDGERPLVLAIDDEPGVLELYARYLEKGGYAVIGLNNANELATYVREYRPAAIVLDLNLPGKTGWDAIAELKAAEDTRAIPVIVCSIEEDGGRAAQLGAEGYVVKPVIGDDLLRALHDALSRAAAGFREALILDADEPFARALGEALEAACGCQARIGTTGLAGLEAVSERPPDVVVMDFDLPDMDGYGLLMALRTQDGLRDLPVVVLTDQAIHEHQLEPLNREATHTMSKDSRAAGELAEDLAALLLEIAHG